MVITNGLLLSILVITQVLGDIWLSRGMKQFGAINSFTPATVIALISYLFTSYWIWLGVATLAFSMLIYLISISRMDISYVLPIHSSSYVLNGLMAWLILKEHIYPTRWLATAIVAVGVFIISRSDKNSIKSEIKPSRKTWLLGFPLGLSLSKIWLGIFCLALVDSMGDLLAGKAMKQVGTISNFSVKELLSWGKRVISNPYFLVGIGGYTTSFVLFICLLSWADISLVRPATAMGYAMSLLGARYLLQEHISRSRLMGIVVIGFGVAILSMNN